MLGHRRGDGGWRPWLQQSYVRDSTGYSSRQHENLKTFVLFVRISHDDKSEMMTLRDLHDGVKTFEVKCDLELHCGIPTNFMEMRSVHEKSFEDNTALILGKNVAFGDTIRVKLNEFWNGLTDAAWRGSMSNLKRCLILLKRHNSTVASSSNSELGVPNHIDSNDILSKALFIASRLGDVKLCKLLLKNGASTMYTTHMGNTCLHVASHAGHLSLVQLLVTNGSNIRSRNVRGSSPLDTAATRGYFDCSRWLWLNQWSVSIKRESLSHMTPREVPRDKIENDCQKVPETAKRPISADAKPTFQSSFEIHSPSIQEKRRPKTAVYTRQLKTLDSKLGTRASLTQPRSFVSGRRKHFQGYNKVTLNGLEYNKTRTILAYFASKKEHQKSIPGKNVNFDTSITNTTTSAWSSIPKQSVSKKTSTKSMGRKTNVGPEEDATLLNKTWDKTRTTNLSNSSFPERNLQKFIERDSKLCERMASPNSALSFHFNGESQEAVEVTSSLPKPILLPFAADETTQSSKTESFQINKMPCQVITDPRNTVIRLSMSMANQEAHSEHMSVKSGAESDCAGNKNTCSIKDIASHKPITIPSKAAYFQNVNKSCHANSNPLNTVTSPAIAREGHEAQGEYGSMDSVTYPDCVPTVSSEADSFQFDSNPCQVIADDRDAAACPTILTAGQEAQSEYGSVQYDCHDCAAKNDTDSDKEIESHNQIPISSKTESLQMNSYHVTADPRYTTIQLTLPMVDQEAQSEHGSVHSGTECLEKCDTACDKGIERHKSITVSSNSTISDRNTFTTEDTRQSVSTRQHRNASTKSLQHDCTPSNKKKMDTKLSDTVQQASKTDTKRASNQQDIIRLIDMSSPKITQSNSEFKSEVDSRVRSAPTASSITISGIVRNEQVIERKIPKRRDSTIPKSSSPKLSRKHSDSKKHDKVSRKSSLSSKKRLSSINSEQEGIERNRKAFETWLMKKREADEKRKEEEESMRKKQAASRRISSGLTFDEWLHMKRKEVIENNEAVSRSDVREKSPKRAIRLHKTYDEWVKEKEEESRARQDYQKFIEAKNILEAQQEGEKKKQEYDKKKLEWLKKKEEIRKLEQEQKRKRESMSEELATAEYQEWLSKPRVQTFEEWAKAKEERARLEREIANAEKHALAQKEKEDEERRKLLAKKKFKLWVKKKDEKRLQEAKQELERSKQKTMLLKSNSLYSCSDKLLDDYNTLNTIEEDPATIDRSVESDNPSSRYSEDEEESVFQISVHITKKSLDNSRNYIK